MKAQKSYYEYFKEALDSEKVGQVRRAWFTTFNLDIHFFERFVFPLLTGKDHTQLQTPLDYEMLSQALDYESEQPEPERLELRIFYDYRKLEQSAQAKLTTARLHPVDVADLRDFNGKKRFVGGVFHPKVALIENQNGALWVMTGSANLTLSGWSRNCECIAFEPITDSRQARSVHTFFYELFRRTHGSRMAEQHPLLQRLANGRAFAHLHDSKPHDWQFISSFDEEGLLDNLEKEYAEDLTVWSPYFDRDLDSLIKRFPSGFDKIDIIPAPNKEGRIGIAMDAYKDLQENKRARLLEDTYRSTEQFTHAKIWMSGNKTAIGSWNCTESGMNLSNKGRNNIEAGIIYRLSTREKNENAVFFKLKALKNPELSTEKDLEEDKEGILEDFSFSISLELNWTSLKIVLSDAESINILNEKLNPKDRLVLPGIGKCDPMKLSEGIDIRGFSANFLTDRSYTFESSGGKILYRGYLLESGLDERPVLKFKDIDDYLSGWIKGRPEDQKFRQRLNYESQLDTSEDLTGNTRAILSTSTRNTWFTAFFAFDQIAYRILSVKNTFKTKKERQQAYIRLGRTLPGNLTELKGHLRELSELLQTEPEKFNRSPVYLWFLIEKANAVFNLFNRESEMEEETIPPLRNFNLEQHVLLNTSRIDIDSPLRKWNRFVINKLNDWEWNT